MESQFPDNNPYRFLIICDKNWQQNPFYLVLWEYKDGEKALILTCNLRGYNLTWEYILALNYIPKYNLEYLILFRGIN